MITRIHIRNFKSLQDVTVDLGPFTVLIGQNGAGKSSFLQALSLLGWLVSHRSINDALQDNGLTYNELVYLRAPSSRMVWELDIEVHDPRQPDRLVKARVHVSLAKRRYAYVSTELVQPADLPPEDAAAAGQFWIGRVGKKIVVAREGPNRLEYRNVTLPHSVLLDVCLRPTEFPVLSAIAREISGFMHYEIWGPESLRRPSAGTATALAERGQNLPSVLHSLRNARPEEYGRLMEEVRGAYAWLDAIEIRRLGEGQFALSFLEKTADKRRRRVRYQPSQVSDGFLRYLALTTLRHQANGISILGYEEPENGMHPGMLQRSVETLRQVSSGGTQVIITTHSPFLLQFLLSANSGGDPERELRLVWRGADGKTEIRPPNKRILAKAQAQGVGVGELWSMLLDERRLAESGRTREGAET